MVNRVKDEGKRWMKTSSAWAIATSLVVGIATAGEPRGSVDGQPKNDVSGQRPNVVVLLADDLGFSDLGCYGGEISTPHLDRLAEDGLRMSQFYNTGRCWPTRASIMTGHYAQSIRHDQVAGLRTGSRVPRPDWAPMIVEPLAAAGYRCYHSGKWHLDAKPVQAGYDRSYWLKDHNRFFNPKVHYLDDQALPPVGLDDGYYASVAIGDHAVECLADHVRDHGNQPFFSYVCFNAPHFPLQAPDDLIDRYRDDYDAGWDVIRQRRYQRLSSMLDIDAPLSPRQDDVGPPYDNPKSVAKLGPGEVNRPLAWSQLDDDQQRFQATKMAIHAAMVEGIDHQVGRIVDQLRRDGRLDNTLILFLSDNGGSAELLVRGDGHDPTAAMGSAATYLCLGPGWSTAANTPFRYHKTWNHEGGIATPLIAHWPRGMTSQGAVTDAVGHVIDFFPTILEVAGVDPPDAGPPRPGVSLVPVLRGDADIVGKRTLWWKHEINRAVRVGNWKLVATGEDSPWELYDLSIDRTETDNLATKRPDRVNELAMTWQRILAEVETNARSMTAQSD